MKKVRVEATEDEKLYFGHAIVKFHESLPAGPVRLIVSRTATDTPFLGTNGWQAGPAALEVETVSQAEDLTVLRAGAVFCDQIPFHQPVRLQVDGADVFGEVFWPEVGPSMRKYVSPLGKEPAVVVPPSPPEPEAPTPPPIPVPPPPLPPQPPVEETKPAPVKDTRKMRRGWVFPLLLLLALAAVAGRLYTHQDWVDAMLGRHEQEPPAPAQPVETLAAKLDRLRQSDTTGEQLLALNDEAFRAGDRTIAQQAIDLAVERGNEAAKLRVARWYDPQTFDPQHVSAKDANKAARSYFELALGGNAEAKTLLTSICQAGHSGGADYEGFFETTYCQGSIE